MSIKREDIYAVGFDLDGTLYPATSEIDARVRDQIAIRLMNKIPELLDRKVARNYFEQRYLELQSGSKVLQEAGYTNAREVMDECLARADVLDLLHPDKRFQTVFNNLFNNYNLYLITSSPEKLALQKLERLGLDQQQFYVKVYGDTSGAGDKPTGRAFDYLLKKLQVPTRKQVYIGDRKSSDILPAKRLGMKTIAVWSEIPEADISIKHINDLEGILL